MSRRVEMSARASRRVKDRPREAEEAAGTHHRAIFRVPQQDPTHCAERTAALCDRDDALSAREDDARPAVCDAAHTCGCCGPRPYGDERA